MSNSGSPYSPADKNPDTRPLRRGDLVRVSQSGLLKARRFKDREGHLGRIIKVISADGADGSAQSSAPEDDTFDVEWVLGGRLVGCVRSDLVWTSADKEGMTCTSNNRRDKRKPTNFMAETLDKDLAKKQRKEAKAAAAAAAATTTTTESSGTVDEAAIKKPKAASSKAKKAAAPRRKPAAKVKADKSAAVTTTTTTKSNKKPAAKRSVAAASTATTAAKGNKKQKVEEDVVEQPTGGGLDLYEKHRREFERCLVRLEEKVDCFRHFSEEAPEPFIERYDESSDQTTMPSDGDERPIADESRRSDNDSIVGTAPDAAATSSSLYPLHAPFNWEMIRRRMRHGRYVLDRRKKAEEERLELLGPYLQSLGKKRNRKNKKDDKLRILYPIGVDWQMFQKDVFAMCEAAMTRQSPDDREDDDGQRGTLSYTIKKVKEAVQQTVERAGIRHATEMAFADDRHKFALAVQMSNTEAAMQSWRKVPFPERKYERITSDVVCAGLSHVDEKIASFELQTNLPDSFVGQSYRYDDTGQSEAWMKSVVDETGSSNCKSRKKNSTVQKADDERLAALALAADDGVTRAQVSATMQSLLIEVQDKVMTEANVLKQPELRSANWIAADCDVGKDGVRTGDDNAPADAFGAAQVTTPSEETTPEIVEQPVWGIDCYTRRNILNCLEIEFDPATALVFVEKWLLPAINACPEDLAHNLSNASRILEGLPFELTTGDEGDEHAKTNNGGCSDTSNESLLLRSLMRKIEASSPPWLRAAANQLRRARAALGPDFFRVHPKGHGSVVLSQSLKANALVTFYHGELYPSWRWGEKMDAIEITQKRKDLKPNLPDFYNMALERPQRDPRGYGLLFVDASRKAGHGSSLSHSCAPTCEVRVAAYNGELCLAMTTLRELEMGEELTFDYNAVTESLNEYRSAVCLCGYGRCRGSFLHFATADCYQQVLNRNSPIATRFANLIKGSMKRIMSQDDELVLRNHGFLTAAFGAISVNRRVAQIDGEGHSLVDTLDMVPVWLRTYVADVLRYIEYERRALPIALICEHLATSQKEEPKSSSAVVVTKEPNLEPSFFYFSRTQSDFLRTLLRNEGFPETLSGLQLKHTMQKVAASYWGALSDEKKQEWKAEAKLDYEKKLKAWKSGKKKPSVVETKQKHDKERSKPEIDDILNSSKISFQDADAEGVVAMEQRIQQLTQTLSRIGRVLDRHREGSFQSNPDSGDLEEGIEARVLAPLRVLRDDEVVAWMWNNNDGIWSSLVRAIERSRCARPQLLDALKEVRLKYGSLDGTGDRQMTTPAKLDHRQLLTSALLEARSAILRDLKEMTKEFRRMRVNSNGHAMDEARSHNSSHAHSDDESLGIVPVNAPEAIETSHDLPGVVTVDVSDNAMASGEVDSEDVARPPLAKPTDWLDFYNERFTLEAAADLLLMYARTSNFFVLQPYRALESTPVEVYARELGNVVPRSVIDDDLSASQSKHADDLAPAHAKAVPDQSPDGSHQSRKRRSLDVSTSPSEVKKGQGELCSPDDVIAKVAVNYQGDYVLSQLLQWYNAGIGSKPGLPDLLGCTMLPQMSDCFSSELLRTTRLKADRKTAYETRLRPRLVEWMQDPYQRGNPWPQEIRKAFLSDSASLLDRDVSSEFLPFGTPIMDFLVTGDESNIDDVLNELDADDKVTAKASGAGLLSSIDKGRPAQAVSNWVQCEHPNCMKWRKIPWYVDADLLPSKFYCEDNIWNPECNSCEAPEDDWDAKDALVGDDGKVEGTPVKKIAEEMLAVSEEASFIIGNRFDVKRSDRDTYSVAFVTKVDFSGTVKRIMFHFSKTSSDRDEWVEFGSPRIAPLYSITSKKSKKASTKPGAADKAQNPVGRDGKKASTKTDGAKESSETNAPPKVAKAPKKQLSLDPSNEKSFVVGARFDVYRHQSKRFCYAVVKEVDFTYDRNRILFHFTKTQDKFDEWIEFGSPRICAFKSKVVTKKDKQVQNDENTLSMEKKLSIEAASISKSILRQEPALEIQDTVFRRTSLEPDVLFPQVSEASDTNENPQGDAASPTTVERIESPAFAVSDSALFEQTGRRSSLAHDVIPVVHPSLHSVTAKADHLVAPSGSNVWQTSSDHFSDMNICRYANVQGYAGEHSFGSMASATHVSNMKPRPPDFITAGREPTLDFASHNHSNNFSEGQMMWNSSAMNDARFASSAVGLSGLDILAAVTHHHALGSSSAAMEMCTNGTANNQAHGFGQPLFHREQAHDVVHGFAPKQQQQHPHPSSSMGHPTNGCLPFSGSQFGWQ